MPDTSMHGVHPRFSICIPNFNYGRYIAETMRGVLDQSFASFEMRIADNASTDDSLAVIATFDDARIHVKVNHTNVGLGPNLDHAAGSAVGDIMVLLSSDDLMRPGALDAYDQVFASAPNESLMVASTVERVNTRGEIVQIDPVDRWLWQDAVVDEPLSEKLGYRVLTQSPKKLLQRCLLTMRTPFTFAATAYSRTLYEAVGGYRGNRFYGPDKWFHWLTLAKADRVYMIDHPFFAYRWHDDNQKAIEASRMSLRYLVDEYLNTLEAPDWLLAAGDITRDDLIDAFIEYDIARHGFASLARGNADRAKQVVAFAQASYRSHMKRNTKARLLQLAVHTGPLGPWLAKSLHGRVKIPGAPPRGNLK